jgi:uncharacterized membrane protein YgcG
MPPSPHHLVFIRTRTLSRTLSQSEVSRAVAPFVVEMAVNLFQSMLPADQQQQQQQPAAQPQSQSRPGSPSSGSASASAPPSFSSDDLRWRPEHVTPDGLHSIDLAAFLTVPISPTSLLARTHAGANSLSYEFKLAIEIDGPRHFYTYIHPYSGDVLQCQTGPTIARNQTLEAQGWWLWILDTKDLEALRMMWKAKQKAKSEEDGGNGGNSSSSGGGGGGAGSGEEGVAAAAEGEGEGEGMASELETASTDSDLLM